MRWHTDRPATPSPPRPSQASTSGRRVTTTDRQLMGRAIALAERGRGRTAPNPLVGCVVVRDGHVVGEGWHERAGGPHAEVAALADAGTAARGATAYVTLEPCDHQGRTPPCSRALVDAGVAQVRYGLADPNGLAAGGHATLAAAGVDVVGGCLADWVAEQNRTFVHAVTTGRPHLTLKLAQTLDGALTVPGRRWLTSFPARQEVHRQRDVADAVLVGIGTVLADDPRLDVRHVPARGRPPRPVVVDSHGRTPVDARVVRPGAIVLCTDRTEPSWRDAMEHAGVEVVAVDAGPDGRVDLGAGLVALATHEVTSVLAEPGATLAGALVAARLVDRLVVHVATDVAGADGVPRLARALDPPRRAGWAWRTTATGRVGGDREVVAVPAPTSTAT